MDVEEEEEQSMSSIFHPGPFQLQLPAVRGLGRLDFEAMPLPHLVLTDGAFLPDPVQSSFEWGQMAYALLRSVICRNIEQDIQNIYIFLTQLV